MVAKAKRFSKSSRMAGKAKKKGRKAVKGEEGGLAGFAQVMAGVILMAGGACAFLYPVDHWQPLAPMLIGGIVAFIVGLVVLVRYFLKWGKF